MDVAKMQGLISGIKQIREDINVNGMSPEEANALNGQGIEEYNKENCGRAYELFLEAAQNGDAWGMYNFADMSHDIAKSDEGTAEDMEDAFYWFKKAAQKGIPNAMFETGLCYYRGEGTEKDVVQAFAWCKKAAENDVINAMNWLGGFYRDGEGVMQNCNKAIEWFEKSAKGGNEYAAFNVAYLYDKGAEGVPVDKSKSFYWYKQSANAGHDIAMNNLGYAYQQGEGTKSDAVKAAEWYIKAIEKGNETAGKNLENLFRDLSEARRDVVINELNNRIGKDGLQIARNCVGSINDSSSDCFITTAVCDSFNKPDDCYELTSFRIFRDTWLVAQPDGKLLIDEYYDIAPKIVKKINQLPNSKEIYSSIWDKYLKPCLSYIEQGNLLKCKNSYIQMVRDLMHQYC